jgi:hypothetical protein
MLTTNKSDLEINNISAELNKMKSDDDFQFIIDYLTKERDKAKTIKEQNNENVSLKEKNT